METQTKSNYGLFSAIFFLIASFVMGYLFFAILILGAAFSISQPELNVFLTIYYYLIIITALWFFLYGILMFFRQFSKKKSLTITNFLFILMNFACFVMLCVLINNANLGAVFQLLWLYLIIMFVGLFAGISLLKNIRKQNINTESKPVDIEPEVFTADGNSGSIELNN